MSQPLLWVIIAAHLSVYLVCALNVWIFSYHSEFYKTVLRLRSLPLIYCGHACFAIGSSYEIAEHIGDDWIYISRLSDLNLLFYAFIGAGLCLVALGLRKSRLTDLLLIASLVLIPLTYGANGGKGIMQAVQLLPTVIFVAHWYLVMRDWRVFLYPLLSNVIALGSGIALIATGNQVFHIGVGFVSAIALAILGYVAWIVPAKLSSGLDSKG